MSEQSDTAENRLKETVFIVEANGFESHMLWQNHSTKSLWPPRDRGGKLVYQPVEWEQVSPGWLVTVGTYQKQPVCISTQWARINGQLVMFYYATSRIVHNDLIKKWLETNFKGKWDNGTRRAQTDAMNFGHCLEAIKQVKNHKRRSV